MRVFIIDKNFLIKLIVAVLILCAMLFAIPIKQSLINVFNPNKQIPIYCVDVPEKKIAITFDCAWGGDDIDDIAEVLKTYNAKATFFMVGDWIEKYPENVKLLSSLGHEISNHSENHYDMTKLSQEKIIDEIQKTNKRIEDLTLKKNNLFRAPYGAYNNNLMTAAKSISQYVIQWDVDSLDWKDLGVESIVNRINKKVKNGSIILFHNDTKYTSQALPTILHNLKEKEYKFVTVSELIYHDNYYIDSSGVQHYLIKETTSID